MDLLWIYTWDKHIHRESKGKLMGICILSASWYPCW